MRRNNKHAENRGKNELKNAQRNYTKIKSKKNYTIKAIRRDCGPRN